jgi:hypothetical protein
MNHISTLIYLVNNFQADLTGITGCRTESFFTESENKTFSPSEQTIDNILNFARSYEVLKTETTGHVEMILN